MFKKLFSYYQKKKNQSKIELWWHLNNGAPNFGDILNPYLVTKISKRQVVYSNVNGFKFSKTHLVIGSILAIANKNCIVWGAGIVKKDENVGKAKFLAVRGPQTRKRLLDLGYTVPEIYGDPALLLPIYFNPEVDKKFKLGIIPHHVDFEEINLMFKNNTEVKVINLLNENVEDVIKSILECEATISSSLHGIIVSQAYNIPSLWFKFSNKLFGDDIKFQDYFQSVNIQPYSPFYLSESETIITILNEIENSKSMAEINVNLNEMQNNLLSACPFLPKVNKTFLK